MLKSIQTLYRVLDAIRRLILNVGFLLTVLILGVFVWLGTQTGTLEKGSLLRIDLTGQLVETLPEADRSFLKTMIGNDFRGETRLSDVTEALRIAASDPLIAGVVLNIQDLTGAGMAGIREVGQAIDRYREMSGKKVWVWSSSYTQAQYLIGLHADHLAVHPMGMVELKGLSSTSLYFGGFFDFFGIEPEVRKAGAFKSAPEIFIAEEPSEANLLAQKSYMDEAWRGLSGDIEKRRGLKDGSVSSYLDGFADLLDNQSSLTEVLCERGYVDAVETWEVFEDKLANTYTDSGKSQDIYTINYLDYLNFYPRPSLTEPGVGVIVLEGEITQMPDAGGITPDRVAMLLSDAAADPNVKALLLRINSPGGDAVASEMIRSSLEAFKTEKKVPVVVSMGDAAASGGYWISTVGDKIVADPYSITGSIGVFAMTFHAETLRERLDIGRGGYSTSPLADVGRPFSGPSALENRWIDHEVNRTYYAFKKLVGDSRNMSPEAVEAVAQGRVWMGTQALENGLVDRVGGYDEAMKLAIELASLSADARSVRFEPVPEGMRAVLMSLLQASVGKDLAVWVKSRAEWDAFVALSGKPLVRLPVEPTL